MSKDHTFTAHLKYDSNQGTFELTCPRQVTVSHGDSTTWEVQVDNWTPTAETRLLLAFEGSNSRKSPPSGGRELGRKFWPFTCPPDDNAKSKDNPLQAVCAASFDAFAPESHATRTKKYTVKEDDSITLAGGGATSGCEPPRGRPLVIIYDYRLWASIPAADLPKNVKPNSANSVADWPDVCKHGDDYLVLTSGDPEVWVDEC